MAIFVLVSLCSQAMSVLILNGLSFSDWSEQVQFHIGVLDLIWFNVEKLAAINDASSNEEKTHYKA